MDDSELLNCNESELLQIAFNQGLGRLKRNLPRETLLRIVRGEEEPQTEHYPNSKHTRELLEKFIQRHWEKTRSQLPGCDGHCTTFPCSEGRHAACYSPNKELVKLG